jgi:dipeptidyl aminopeptidase/acylaminoacyl peptidase
MNPVPIRASGFGQLRLLLAAVAAMILLGSARPSLADLDLDPNVLWTFRDSIAACPAGDSLVFGTNPHKPSQLRFVITYLDASRDPKVGVPPESIYVTTSSYTGNAMANDQPKIYADDSTNASGETRVTIRSLSGVGRLRVRFFVSGVEQGGFSMPHVRTTDTNADGRVTSGDATGMADLNYDGSAGLTDLAMLATHLEHFNRHALFGTPVRRTHLYGNEGNGTIDWEPNQSRIAYSAHITTGYKCRILTVPADPSGGNTPTLFTWDGADSNDYDPTWSPRGHEIAFDRNDKVIYRKGLPGSADTTKIPVVSIPDSTNEFVTRPAFSPNGRKIAYCHVMTSPSNHTNIYVVELPDGAPQQLTRSKTVTDAFPRWSPDGEWIYFSRYTGSGNDKIWKVKADGTDSMEVYAPSGVDARLPSPSPDGSMLVVLREEPISDDPVPHTLELGVSSPAAIANYTPFASDAARYPVISPDGTRLAFFAAPVGGGYSQLWAVRRNMDRPPTISSIGDRTVEEGSNLSFTVSVSDPESDTITRSAHFLESGMSFTPSTGAFSWTPGGGTAGNSYWVKFRATVPSGGTASEVVKISVIEPGLQELPLASSTGDILAGANPSPGPFMIAAPASWASDVELRVFDVRGRLVSLARAKAGVSVHWDGREQSGARAPQGIYFYELRGDKHALQGKWVLVR